jgi:hypothetical protein
METPPQDPIRPHHLLPQLSQPRILLILSGAVIFLVVPAIWFIWTAFASGHALPVRGINLLFAALLLFVPVSAASILLRRKWRTGCWMPSAEERAQRWKEYRSRRPSWPSWYKPTMTLIWLSLPCLWVVKQIYRPTHGWGRGPSDLLLLIAALNLWLLYRTPDSKSAPKA